MNFLALIIIKFMMIPLIEDISEYIHMLITLSRKFALAELNPTILLVLFTVTLDSHILKIDDSLDSLFMLESWKLPRQSKQVTLRT